MHFFRGIGSWPRGRARVGLVGAGVALAAGVLAASAAGGRETLPPAPLVANGWARVTRHDEMLAFLRACVVATPRCTLETIGRTREGREIPLVRVRPAAAATTTAGERGTGAGDPLKVLIFCQQHGNEASGKEAVLLWLRRFAAGEPEALPAGVELYLVPSVNPDGNEAGRRTNAAGADLNRNHLLLTEPEVRALHDAAARIDPAVTLDVHEYNPYGREWLAAGCTRRMDEQFGAATHPNVSPRLVAWGERQLFPFLREELAARGVVFFEYIILDRPTDSARRSTTSVNDGRQSFAIRNTVSFILEGRNGRTVDEALERRAGRQLVALEAFLRFVGAHAGEIGRLVREEAAAIAASREPVALQMEHGGEQGRLVVPVERSDTGAATWQEVAYRPEVRTTLAVPRPSAYVVRRGQAELIAWLDRQHVRYETVTTPRTERLEILTVTGEKTWRTEGRSYAQLETRARREAVRLEPGDVVVPLAQRAGTLVAIAWEPASMWGLVNYEEFKALRTVGVDYPVWRRP